MKIKASTAELLLNYISLTEEQRAVLQSAMVSPLDMDDTLADTLRDACNDYIDEYGYDQNYELTEVGKKIQTAADEIYLATR